MPLFHLHVSPISMSPSHPTHADFSSNQFALPLTAQGPVALTTEYRPVARRAPQVSEGEEDDEDDEDFDGDDGDAPRGILPALTSFMVPLKELYACILSRNTCDSAPMRCFCQLCDTFALVLVFDPTQGNSDRASPFSEILKMDKL